MTSKRAPQCSVYITLPGEVSATTADRFANARNLLSQHARFLLEKDEAEKILGDLTAQVGGWHDTARACGVSEGDAETIRGAFLYPGFSR